MPKAKKKPREKVVREHVEHALKTHAENTWRDMGKVDRYEKEKALVYPRFALSTRLEGSGRNGARGVKTAGRPARAPHHHDHHECPGCNRFH